MNMYEVFSQKYPVLFRNKDEREPINLFGIECSCGWRNLLDKTFYLLTRRYQTKLSDCEYWKTKAVVSESLSQEDINKKIENSFILLEEEIKNIPTAAQIKEKFGTLRLYFDNVDSYSQGVIDMAESMSEEICETCGQIGKLRDNSWIRTLCDNCNNK